MIRPARAWLVRGPATIVTCAAALVALRGAVACSGFGSESDDASDGGSPPSDGATTAEGGASDGGPTTPCDPSTLDTNPKHCGACGHDCLGGACVAKTCQPVVVAGGYDRPILSIALGPTFAAWMPASDPGGGAGAVHACPKEGCAGGAPTVLVAQRAVANLASDGTAMFASFAFGNRGVVHVEPTSVTSIDELASHQAPFWLVVRDGALYMNAFYESDAGAASRTIVRWTNAGATTVGTFVSPPGENINTMHTVVTDRRAFLGAINVGRIVTCSLDACSWEPFLTDDVRGYVVSMASDDRRLFWTDGNLLRSCSATTSPCTSVNDELAPPNIGDGAVRTVAYDHGVLLLGTDKGDLYACDPHRCRESVKLLAHEAALDDVWRLSGHAIAADDRAVWYAARDPLADGGGTSRIMKIAR